MIDSAPAHLQVIMPDGIPFQDIRKQYLPSSSGPFIRQELCVDEIDAEDVGNEDDDFAAMSALGSFTTIRSA